jgi:hypothetical protein
LKDLGKSELHPDIRMEIVRTSTRILARKTEIKVEVGTHDLLNMRQQ